MDTYAKPQQSAAASSSLRPSGLSASPEPRKDLGANPLRISASEILQQLSQRVEDLENEVLDLRQENAQLRQKNQELTGAQAGLQDMEAQLASALRRTQELEAEIKTKDARCIEMERQQGEIESQFKEMEKMFQTVFSGMIDSTQADAMQRRINEANAVRAASSRGLSAMIGLQREVQRLRLGSHGPGSPSRSPQNKASPEAPALTVTSVKDATSEAKDLGSTATSVGGTSTSSCTATGTTTASLRQVLGRRSQASQRSSSLRSASPQSRNARSTPVTSVLGDSLRARSATPTRARSQVAASTPSRPGPQAVS